MAKNSNVLMAFILGAVVIVGALFFMGGGQFSTVGGDDVIVSPEQVTNCDSTTTPNLTIKSYDKENVGTALTEGTNLYRKAGDKTWTAFTAGTGFAASVGDVLEIVMGISTSDVTDNAYGQYIASYTVPCAETPSIEYEVVNDEIETSVSATFYNADGDAAAEAFVAGQTQTVSLKLLSGTDEFFGNPYIADSGIAGPQRGEYPNVVCLDLNTTTWDQPIEVSFAGTEMRKVGEPQVHAGASGTTTYCYEAPVIDDTAMENNRYLLRLNADDSNAPVNDMTAYIYPAGFYVDSETGDVAWGVETDEGANVGADTYDSVTLDFTA